MQHFVDYVLLNDRQTRAEIRNLNCRTTYKKDTAKQCLHLIRI